MSSQPFAFPPPPPPPQPHQVASTYIHHAGSSNGRGISTRGRGNRGDRGFQSRGRGQGNFKFGSRGGYNNSGYQGGNAYTPSREGYGPPSSTHASGYPLPEYPPVQQTQPAANLNNGYTQNPSRYPPAVGTPSNNQIYYNNMQQSPQQFSGNPAPTSYSHNIQSAGTSYILHDSRNYGAGPPRQETSNPPLVQGPPIRMGFQGGHLDTYQQDHITTQSFPPPIPIGTPSSRHDPPAGTRPSFRQPQPNPYNQRDSGNHFSGHRNRGQKRGHQDAFSRPPPLTKPVMKTQVAPAVPSFGIPLPVKPPAPLEAGRKRKKKRRHNQLGLTPKTVEHESSEEEDNDIDEEAKLAVAAGYASSEPQPLHFMYKGQRSTLQSASEIASWVEERKKRFPTKARIAEKAERARQLREELQAARRNRESSARQNAEAKERERTDAKATRKAERKVMEGVGAKIKKEIKSEEDTKENSLMPNGPAERAKLKIEKLQRHLQKVEIRAAKAAAKVSKLRAEASRYEGFNQIKEPSPESMKVEGRVKIEIAEMPTPNQGIKTVSEAIPLKEENLERFGHTNGEIALSGVDHTDAGDGALESSGKLPGPLTPTSQPCVQRLAELDPEHEASAIAVAPVEQASDVSRLRKDDPGDLIDPANPQKSKDVAIGSSFSASISSSSSITSLTDSEDETSSSDESSSSSSSCTVPESRPSKRIRPDRVAPPKRFKRKPICRNFLHHGRCKKGDACAFRHELPNRAHHGERHNRKPKKANPGEEKRRRIGLYQRLVEQEQAQEALESHKTAAEEANNRPLDEAATIAIPAID